MIQDAMKQMESGNTEEAFRLLENIAKKGTDEEKYEAARYYHAMGFLEQALVIAEELHILYPGESEIALFLADVYIDFDREDEAIEVLNEIGEEDEVYVQALLLLADLYQTQGLDEVAETKLLAAKHHLPDEPIVDFGLGEFYSSRGDFVKAVPYYMHILSERKIGDVNISLRLAEALSSLGNWEEAILHYEEGLKDQKDIHTLFGYAFTLYQAMYYERALPVFLELKELDPQYTALYVYAARCYEEQGMLQESYDLLREGVKTDEFSVDFHVRLADAAARLGNIQEAEGALLEALALDPAHMEAVSKYIYILQEQDKHEEIVEAVKIAVENGEDDPQLTWDRARAEKELELYSDALKHYRDAYTSFKDNLSFLEEYGLFLLEEGERAEAREVFEKILQLDSTQTHIEELLYNL
ncbi:tetratricopeptide repeat protein [Ectobacillus sp. JY-23]|uniref:tetratricopeptide repeat protein n=1 Tax=Ectobacillus sp. JY-23 TaxID=2933872 RepID=UPI001FF2F3A4|nr:tetratricopeptide repeat protein [Ectobacillus sp. JY-23]UOY93467.1 tetratricopeptide repeat protein [Ectobacillus sp. JY-23]